MEVVDASTGSAFSITTLKPKKAEEIFLLHRQVRSQESKQTLTSSMILLNVFDIGILLFPSAWKSTRLSLFILAFNWHLIPILASKYTLTDTLTFTVVQSICQIVQIWFKAEH